MTPTLALALSHGLKLYLAGVATPFFLLLVIGLCILQYQKTQAQ